MPNGYGTNYGYKYSLTWQTGNGTTTAGTTPTATSQTFAGDGGQTTATATVQPEGDYGDDYGAKYGGVIKRGARVFEDGQATATGASAGVGATAAFEAGGTIATGTALALGRAKAAESGAATTQAALNSSPVARIFETGTASATGTPFYSPFVLVAGDTDPVETILKILQNIPIQNWMLETPTIEYFWDVAQSERGPGDGQPPELYVYSPIDTDINRLTADGKYLDEDETVEVQIYVRKEPGAEQTVRQYYRDVIDIFKNYLDDSNDLTEFITVEPTAGTDYRADSIHRRSDCLVMSVDVETKALR